MGIARQGPLLAACLLLAGAATAQPLVRMNPGQGATLFNIGGKAEEQLLLGSPAPSATGLVVEGTGTGSRLCCAAVLALRCESSRGLPVGAMASSVRDRHGPPTGTSHDEMRYPGILFRLDPARARVVAICVFRP